MPYLANMRSPSSIHKISDACRASYGVHTLAMPSNQGFNINPAYKKSKIMWIQILHVSQGTWKKIQKKRFQGNRKFLDLIVSKKTDMNVKTVLNQQNNGGKTKLASLTNPRRQLFVFHILRASRTKFWKHYIVEIELVEIHTKKVG